MTASAFVAGTNWHSRADALVIDGRLVIEGERRHAVSRQCFDDVSPVDGRVIARVARGGPADIDAAVASARRAFADGRWAARAPAERKRVMQRFAERVLEARDELALLETLDMGKPIGHALGADVPAAARCISWYAEAVDKVYGEVAPTPAHALAFVTREPVGVVGAIVPWNYPLLMAAWKIAPALALGNSVLLKPSERSPLTALRLAELALEAGLPAGVLNVITGYGNEAGEALALSADVDAIGFTGSTAVGRRMLECAGRSNLKRVFNELGGKSAFVVFADTGSIEDAAKAAAEAMFFNQGESCNAPSRVLVERSIAGAFTEALVEASRAWPTGDPLDTATAMGALVDRAHTQGVLRHIESATVQGAELATGGRRIQADSGGCHVEPTILTGVTNDMPVARQEIFGPVMCVIAFEGEAEAVHIANDSPYGLQAGIWTENVHRAHRMARALHAGTVHVNQYDEDDITVPFGGVKQSGNGRDKSLHAFDKYSELKTTWLRIRA